MIELFTMYSLSEIVTFLVTFALAIKGLVSFLDWAVERIKKAFKKQDKKNREKEILEERLLLGNEKIRAIEQEHEETKEFLKEMSKKVDLLIESDKDSIKSFITKEHHFFCYENKWIDDYSLDCIERRFSHYKDEGGNSFAGELMEELRALPKNPI